MPAGRQISYFPNQNKIPKFRQRNENGSGNGLGTLPPFDSRYFVKLFCQTISSDDCNRPFFSSDRINQTVVGVNRLRD